MTVCLSFSVVQWHCVHLITSCLLSQPKAMQEQEDEEVVEALGLWQWRRRMTWT